MQGMSGKPRRAVIVQEHEKLAELPRDRISRFVPCEVQRQLAAGVKPGFHRDVFTAVVLLLDISGISALADACVIDGQIRAGLLSQMLNDFLDIQVARAEMLL